MISIIILNYNTPTVTRQCVESILQNLKNVPIELIVVDNGSSIKNQDLLKSELITFDEKITLVESTKNLGFGGGNMLGAERAKGEYLCFINSDVTLEYDCLSPACDYLQKNSSTVGCVGLQQVKPNHIKEASFDHGPSILKELFGRSFLEKINPKKYPKRKYYKYSHPLEVIHVGGSLMILPSKLFTRIDGFDTKMFLYYEEYDLSVKLRQYGYKTVFLPSLYYIHIHGNTTNMNLENRKRAKIELYRSKLYVYHKYHYPLFYSLFYLLNITKFLFKQKH